MALQNSNTDNVDEPLSRDHDEVEEEHDNVEEKQDICRRLFESRFFISILIVSNVVWFIIAVVFIGIYEKSGASVDCQFQSNSSTCPEYDSQQSKTTPLPEAFCHLPFPEVPNTCQLKDLGDFKCLLPYTGTFLLNTEIFNGKLTSIRHVEFADRFVLFCGERSLPDSTEVCKERCENLQFSRHSVTVIVVVIDSSCLEKGGQVAIWDSVIYGKKKRLTIKR